jgi:hypothetical protein
MMSDIAEEEAPPGRRPILSRLAVAKARWGAFWPELREELAADRSVYLLAAVYLVIANAISLALPGHPPIFYFLYTPIWLNGAIAAGLIVVLARTLPDLLRERPERPLMLLTARASLYATPRAVAGFALIALQVVLLGTFTSVKNMLPEMSGYAWDRPLANIGRFLCGGHDPWTFLTPAISRLGLLGLVEFLYVTGWMIAVGIIPAIIALVPSLKPIRVRFFLTYILTWALLGNLIALLGMSAGPVYYGAVTGDHARYQGLIDLLAASSGSSWSAYDIQRSLWAVYAHGLTSFGTGISAFPSLHVAMATLWAILGFRHSRRLGIVGLAFLAFVLAASVALGWHYLIDGVASIVLAWLIWAAVGWAQRCAPSRRMESAPEW